MAEIVGTLTLLILLAFITGAGLVFLYLLLAVAVLVREAVKVGRQMRSG